MTLGHSGMDIAFYIERVPCRFFTDDSNTPEKSGFFKRNFVDCLFDIDDQRPVMWRFIVERALTEEDEDKVFFAGYNVYQEKVSEWMYRASTPMLHSVDDEIPPTVDISPARIEVRDDDANSADDDIAASK